VGCIEEVAFEMGFIGKEALEHLALDLGRSEYGPLFADDRGRGDGAHASETWPSAVREDGAAIEGLRRRPDPVDSGSMGLSLYASPQRPVLKNTQIW